MELLISPSDFWRPYLGMAGNSYSRFASEYPPLIGEHSSLSVSPGKFHNGGGVNQGRITKEGLYMRIPLLRTVGTRYALCVVAVIAVATSTSAQINEWVNPGSGNWDNAANWSSGWPHISQSEVRISNAGNKAVAIQPGTPSNFPSTMTVQNLRLDGVPPNTNLLLLNYSGTSLPLRVVRDFNLGANGRVLMLYSGLNVSNMFDLNGVFDQEGGELVFSNAFTSIMQIEGGH